MDRRSFLQAVAATTACSTWPLQAFAADARRPGMLILIELKGGNDGLNTLIPFADAKYYELRPRIAIAREQVVQLTERAGLHPALTPLKALWDAGELAVLQNVGYPNPNLSHFRSIEIWDTASRSDEVLQQGWLTRAVAQLKLPDDVAADGVVIGNSELGPFVGGARAVALSNPAQFVNQAKIAKDSGRLLPGVLGHVVQVESDIVRAATKLSASYEFKTAFPNNAFGTAVRAGAQVLATGTVPVLRLTLNGFDTHQNQPGTHANLLTQLAEGLVALRAAAIELNRWQDTVVLTYAEFGRRPRENASNGTDHGTGAVHFALGGKVKGGMLGAAPDLARLDGSGNFGYAIDFRSVYASVLQQMWNLDPRAALSGSFATLPLLRA
jgi:uncharacterized protein (DUF1501 family)